MVVPSPLRAAVISQLRRGLRIPQGPLSWPFPSTSQGQTGQRVFSMKLGAVAAGSWARTGICSSVNPFLQGRLGHRRRLCHLGHVLYRR